MELDHYLHFLVCRQEQLADVTPEDLEEKLEGMMTTDELRLKLKEIMMDVVARSYIKRIRTDCVSSQFPTHFYNSVR